MMPVIRISQNTWERLQRHARPFEDSPEDIISKALDVFEGRPEGKPKEGKRLTAPQVRKATPRNDGSKIPQREFWGPLLETLVELGGEARLTPIQDIMKKKMAP
ncbi:MAG: hypothetical protein AAB133_04315, partial [Pseudomonadota bacterium]